MYADWELSAPEEKEREPWKVHRIRSPPPLAHFERLITLYIRKKSGEQVEYPMGFHS
jgi:hypothetical protein